MANFTLGIKALMPLGNKFGVQLKLDISLLRNKLHEKEY
jgi:hypothetical protein